MPNPQIPKGGAPSLLRQIDLIADPFERQWRQGNRPRIVDFLNRASPELRLSLLMELICIDFEHRLRNRLPVALADYHREFPELENLPEPDRVDLESHVRRLGKDLGTTVDYVEPPSEPLTNDPSLIGRFKIAGRLGSGGQADAFLSFHPEFKVPVAVKWHRAPESSDAERRRHLIDEGCILAGLDAHPNLLRVYEIGFHEGRPFLVLEHIQGRTLDNYVVGEQPSHQQAAEFVAALAEAVHTAHERDVVHLDINPRNVLIDGRGQPRLIDFGLAWFQSPWTDPTGNTPPLGGTPQFLSPEQADPVNGPIDRQTDVFGLGAVLYFLLTRQPLYNAATVGGVLRQAARTDYDDAALEKNRVPKRLAAVCRKALARDPQARFATATAMATALRAAVRRPRWRGVAALAGLLLIAVVGGWLIGQPGRHEPKPALASNQSALEVRVWREKTGFISLREALPVKTGDELQVRFRVPSGVHLGLCSINGRGQLSLLQQYPPQDASTELVYPGLGKTQTLERPEGTEFLLVCGRVNAPLNEAELKTAWDAAAPWPALEPSSRLLRLEPAQVREEGERPRNLGVTHDRADPVTHRLDLFRDRLRQTCVFFEGLAFAHE